MTMLSEIQEQPRVLQRLLDVNDSMRSRLAEIARDVSHVVIAARGTSDNAARYAQYVWGARNHLPVGLTTPSLFGPLGSPPSLDGSLVVGISQSGQSPDLVEVLTEARRQGRPTLVITNAPDSPLAEQGDCVIDLAVGPERAIAATKSYTGQLAAIALCSVAFAGEDPGVLAPLPSLLNESLAAAEGVEEVVAPLADAERGVVVGRGFQLCTVYEWALKLQELTYILAQPYSAADFLHGPVAMVEEGFPMLVVATSGPTKAEMVELADDMVAKGAHVVTLSDFADAPGHDRMIVPEVEPWLSPIVSAPALQIFARSTAVARGIDPESPRGLTKIVRTR